MYNILLEEGKKALIRWFIVLCALSTAFIFTPLWENGRQIWAAPEVLSEIQSDLKELREEVKVISGEDRVIRMDSALSYVREPYSISSGEPISVNIVIKRTTLGGMCRLISRTPIYTGERGIAVTGEKQSPLIQLHTAPQRLNLQLDPPETLKVGRTVLIIELIFDCRGRMSVIDRTDPLVFMVVE